MYLQSPRHVVDKTKKEPCLLRVSSCKEAKKPEGLMLLKEFDIVLPGGDGACICKLFGERIIRQNDTDRQYVDSEKTTLIELILKA